MLTYINGNGNLIKTVPEKIFQGSNYANTIYLVGAYPQASVVTIAFKLPQTGHYTEPYVMLNANIPTEQGMGAWSFDIPFAITEYSGKVDFQVTIYGGSITKIIDGEPTQIPQLITSAYGTFEVEKGIPVILPETPTQEVYDQILQLIAQIQLKVYSGELFAKGILPYDESFEYPEGAFVYVDDENGLGKQFYVSLVGDNIGNELPETENEYWKKWELTDIVNLKAQTNTNTGAIATINGKIPSSASSSNKLTDKATVDRIQIVDNGNDTFTFTNANNETVTIASGGGGSVDVDNTTIQLNASDELEAIAIKDSNGTITPSDVRTNTEDIATINSKIPSGTTATTGENPLANRDFVNSSIATNTAYFIGTFVTVTALESYEGIITNNDYAFVVNSARDFATTTEMNAYDKTLLTNFDYAWIPNGTKYDLYRFDILSQVWNLRAENIAKTDVTLNTAYNRYKATVSGSTVTWGFEYTLNNSSFTAEQWTAINSGITSALVAQIGTNQTNISTLQGTAVTGVGYDAVNKKITKTIGGTTTDVVTVATLKSDMNIPTYENKPASSGGTDLSLVTTGDKFNWNGKLTKSVKDFDDTGFELTWSSSSNEPCAGVILDRNSGAGTGCIYADDGSDTHALHIDENGVTYNDNQNTSSDTPIFNVSPAGVMKVGSLTDGITTKTMTQVLSSFDTSNIADAFSTSSTYAVGDIVIYNNTLYICTTAVSTAGAWDSSKWTATSVEALLALKANTNQVVRLDTNTDTFTNSSYKRLKTNYGFYFQAVNNDNRLEILPSSGMMNLYYYGSRYVRLDGTGLFDNLYNTYMNFPKASKYGYLILNTDLFPTFSISSTYNVGDVVYYATNGTAGFYKCTTAVTTAGAWNSANWTAVTLQDLLAEYSKNDYISLRLNSEIELTDSNEIQITGLRTAGTNIHNNSLIFDDTNYDKVTIGAGVHNIKVTSIIQYRQASDVTRFGNSVKKNGSDFSNRGSYVGQSSDLTGTTLSSSERRVVVNNSFIAGVAEGDVITFHAKSTGATSSAKDKITSQDAQTHFIIEVVK